MVREIANEPVAVSDAGEVTLNFVDTDIREVLRSILGDVLGKNYVVDPLVQGTITLRTSKPLPRASLLSTLEHILTVNGAALIKADTIYRVVPTQTAVRGVPSVELGADGGSGEPGYGVQVIPLKYVSAVEMAKILEPIAPEASILWVDEARNVLVVAGGQFERQAVLETIEIFDIDWLAGMSFGLFPLKSAEPETLADELRVVMGIDPAEIDRGVLRMIPVERMNALLVVSPQRAYIDRAQTWIARLDVSDDAVNPKVFVYYVQFGRADAIAAVLQQIFGDEGATLSDFALGPGLEPAELDSPRLISDGSQAPGGARATPEFEGRVASSVSAPEVVIGQGSEGPIRIISDDLNNALVILATPGDYERVKEAFRQLDVMPLQVLIEATIAEVTLNDQLQYGLQWFLRTGNSSFTFSELANGAVNSVFPGFSYLFSGGGDARAALSALETVTDVNVISSPQLVVLDNQTALLQVGDSVPIATQSAVSVTDPNAPVVNSIQFRDTGVILTVTPRVNKSGLVIMDIEQEVSDVVATTTSAIDSPTIQQRRITSSVAINSGETVALGGLIRETDSITEAGIPFLRDVPILGFFFGGTDESVRRTELLVLITPRVIRNRQDARDVTDELRRRITAVTRLLEAEANTENPGSSTP